MDVGALCMVNDPSRASAPLGLPQQMSVSETGGEGCDRTCVVGVVVGDVDVLRQAAHNPQGC